MERKERKGRARTVGFILVAGLVGYLIGPPIANALTTVVIKSGATGNIANVDGTHALFVNTEASANILQGFLNTFSEQVPFGGDVLLSGTTNKSKANQGTIDSIVVDNTTGSPATVTITDLRGPDPDVQVWKGTIPAGGHVNDSFDGGIFFLGNLQVVDPGGAQFFVYGYTSGPGAGSLPTGHRG